MPDQPDAEWFRDRARDERDRMRAAQSHRRARVHAEMASHYEVVAHLIDGGHVVSIETLGSALRAMIGRLDGCPPLDPGEVGS